MHRIIEFIRCSVLGLQHVLFIRENFEDVNIQSFSLYFTCATSLKSKHKTFWRRLKDDLSQDYRQNQYNKQQRPDNVLCLSGNNVGFKYHLTLPLVSVINISCNMFMLHISKRRFRSIFLLYWFHVYHYFIPIIIYRTHARNIYSKNNSKNK